MIIRDIQDKIHSVRTTERIACRHLLIAIEKGEGNTTFAKTLRQGMNDANTQLARLYDERDCQGLPMIGRD